MIGVTPRASQELKADFGALAAQAGDAGINDVVLAYLIACPPSHASLRHAGDRLAAYLADDPRAEPFRSRWPWCAAGACATT